MMMFSNPQRLKPQIPKPYRDTAIWRRPLGGHRVVASAGTEVPIIVAKTVRMIEVLVDRPKSGLSIPIGISVRLVINENHKKTICRLE
jgi:hypothetical protein